MTLHSLATWLSGCSSADRLLVIIIPDLGLELWMLWG